MKKVFIFFTLLVGCYNAICIDKPLIKFGSNSLTYLTYNLDKELFYPSSSSDNFYFYLYEKFNFHFALKYKLDFFYISKNRYSQEISELTILKINNYFVIKININKENSFYILISPMVEKNQDQFLFKNRNKFNYSLKIKNFNFKLTYTNSYLLKEKEKFNHNLSFLFYFNFPKAEFIKYKCELSFYFQHYIYENIIISPLNKALFSFEVAIDFNKITFEDLFNNKNEEIDFNE